MPTLSLKRRPAESETASERKAHRVNPSREHNRPQTPRYMLGEMHEEPSPNYTHLNNQQFSYDQAVRSGLQHLPEPDTISAASPGQDVQTLETPETEPSMEFPGQEHDRHQEDKGEPETDQSQAEEKETESETEESSDEKQEDAVHEDTAGEEGDETESGEAVSRETSVVYSGRAEELFLSGFSRQGGIDMAIVLTPRARIVTPWVSSPPQPAIERRRQIIKKTGSPPELHHAQVRQSVQRVAEAARAAQRQMVRKVGSLASDTRISIEDMAQEILGVTAAAVDQINGAIDNATNDIQAAANAEIAHIEQYGVQTGEDVQANRDAMMVEIFSDLKEGSDHIEEANGVLQERFTEHADIASGRIRMIPERGETELLPMPPVAGGGPESGNAPRENQKSSRSPAEGGDCTGSGTGDSYKIISDARKRLTIFMDEQATLTSDGLPHLKTYKLIRSEPVMQGLTDKKQQDLVKNAEESANRLSSPATRAQFALLALSMTSPVSQHHREDQGETVDENQARADEQFTEAQMAVRNASNILQGKSNRAAEYCRRDLRDTLTRNIRKSGHKAYKGLLDQAELAESALGNSAVSMAEAYRDLVDRLSALLPPGHFLNKNSLIPKIMAARESAQQLLDRHETLAKQQSAETVEKIQEVKQKQAGSIADAGQKSAESVHDVVVRSQFDFSLFSSQMTGRLSDGARNGIHAAQVFADRMAETIIDARDRMDTEGLSRVDSIAVTFLNSSISGAQQSQYQALAGLVRFLERTGEQGMLTKPMADVQKDLEGRASAIDNAMPGQSLGTAAGIAAGGGLLLGPVGVVAAGVYLYCTDADEDVVIENLGNLIWPGVLGLEDVFDHEYSENGTLRNRIEEEMGNPEKGHALRLFSRSAFVRARARRDIAEYSTGWFDYNRRARESALQGMSTEERATLSPEQIRSTSAALVRGLNEHQSEIAVAYLQGNRERAVAARTREALDKAREQGQWGWIFSAESAQRRSDEARVQAMAEMDSMVRAELAIESAYVDEATVEESTREVFREFASIVDPRRRPADQFSHEEAESAMISYAISGHQAMVLGPGMLLGAAMGPLGPLAGPALGIAIGIERVEMSSEASQYISDLVKHGPNSDHARESRAVYEFRRAENESMFGLGLFDDLSETSQIRLSDAFENRELARLQRAYDEAETPLERSRALRQLEEERSKHRQQLQGMARRLGAPEDVCGDPLKAERWMASHVGSLFAREDDLTTTVSHARYGEEMITRGRASLVAGVALATEGAGTHEDLLRRSYQDRSRREIEAANQQWAMEHGGEDMEVMLGIRERQWDASDYALMAVSPAAWITWRGAETSGDLAMELERLSLGNRETDLDHVRYAGLHYNQERVRGTGFLAEFSMQGTPEQRNLDARRERMARVILDEAHARNPEAAADYSNNPGAIFRPDGSIDPAIQAAAFENGNFRGNSALLQHYTQSISLAADAYRAEIDRQESMLTTGITVLALVASIALMCIPGVNVVAAGVISAVIAGAATMIVKAGMRGERYGWEEAAVDLATTGIEAATAGFGGAIAGGLGRAGGLARIGTALSNRLGRVGSAVVRESLVSAISSGAQVAMQDDVWKDGLGAGLEKVLNGSLKGAAMAAVTAGVSEGMTKRLNRSMSPGDIDPADFNRMQRLGRTLGPHGSEVFREGVSELMGAAAGETVGVLTDYATGQFHGKFGDALKRIGQAGLRDMATGMMRGGVMSLNRARYRSLLDTARSGGTLSPKDLRALRLAAISAGAMHYDDGPSKIHGEVNAGRRLLSQLPPGLRRQAANLDAGVLEQIMSKLDAGDLDMDTNRNAFLRDLSESVPNLDPRALMREMELALQGRRPVSQAGETQDNVRQMEMRRQLTSGMEDSLKSVIKDLPLEGLEHLRETDIRTAAEMIYRGGFDSATADAMLRRARQDNPDLNEYTFLRNLHNAVEVSKQAQQIERVVRINRHREVMAAVPEEGRKVFADLPDEYIRRIKMLLDQKSMGTPHDQEVFLQAARIKNPNLTREQFQHFLGSALETVSLQRAAIREQTREKRQRQMKNVPESQRAILSALPDDALVDLRIRQLEGEPLSPGNRRRLIDAALRETPDVDVQRLSDALDEVVAKPLLQVDSDRQIKLRRELEAAVPANQRHLLAEVPILIMRDSEFEAFTRSIKGMAVTLILHGRPVVVMRENADPGVLREEGIHVLQSKDPGWEAQIGVLDERKLSQWDKLPLAEQMALYRNKVALEIDAQQRLASNLESELTKTVDFSEQVRLRTQLEMAQTSLRNLENRAREAGEMKNIQLRAIEAGLMRRPDWLDQPARLFQKDQDQLKSLVEHPKTLSDEISQLDREGLIRRLETPDIADDMASITFLIKHLPEGIDFATHQNQAVFGLLLRNAGMEASEIGQVLERMQGSGNHIDLTRAKDLLGGLKTLRELPGTEIHFHRLVEIIARDTADPSQELSRLIPVVKALTPDQLYRLLSLAGDIQTARKIIKAAAVGDTGAFVRDLTAVMDSYAGKAGIFERVKISLLEMSPRKLHRVADGLNQIKKAVPIDTTFHAMVDTVLTARHGHGELARNLADLARMMDARGRKALASLLDQSDKNLRADYLYALAIQKNTIQKIEKSLFGKESGKLLSLIIETAATQRNWIVTMDSALKVLSTLQRLPQTDANQKNVEKILEYFAEKRGDLSAEPRDFKAIRNNPDLAQLATDFMATARIFKESPDLEKSVEGLVKNLENGRPMAGKDSWRSHLENEAVHWQAMGLDEKSKSFASVLEKLTPGWSDGERGSLRGMEAWFNRLAKIRGIDGDSPAHQSKREALLQEIFDRGFRNIQGARDLMSKSRYDDLTRAFREMTVEASFAADPKGAHIQRELQQRILENLGLGGKDLEIGAEGITREEVLKRMGLTEKTLAVSSDQVKINRLLEELGVPVGTRDIERQHALSRLGITEAELAKRSDREVINQHIEALIRQESKYQRMLAIAEVIDGSTAGLRQNITEVIGEIALSRQMIEKHGNFRLAMPFAKGTGFDQIWIREIDGQIDKIIVGEAKGPGPAAELGTPLKGDQMTAKWVRATIRQMISQAQTEDQKRLVKALMKAVLDNYKSGNMIRKISGIVVQAGDPPDFFPKDITDENTGRGGYNFSGEDIAWIYPQGYNP